MDYNEIGNEMSKNEFFVDDLETQKNRLDSTWKGPAASFTSSIFANLLGKLKKAKENLEVFSSVLFDVEELRKKKLEIARLEKEINSINIYKVNVITKETEIDHDKLLQKERLEELREKCINEYNILKEGIVAKINSLVGGNHTNHSGNMASLAGEISYDDAQVIAKKLQVPVDYVLSLHLHEGYKLGDKMIRDGITPDMIHYAGEHGFPVLIDGIQDRGSEYWAVGRGVNLYKSSSSFTTVAPGREYDITGQPITFEEMEGRNVYWTWYGPIVQGFGGVPTPIQCTASSLYPCDDGLYRDGDGYIVIAGSPYKNQYYDGVHVNYDAHGGLAEEDLYVLTPFGIGKFYDNGAAQIQNGIESDIYRNDGYESNNIASTKYGKRLRASAVEKYESLNLYWRDLVH